MAAWLNRFKLYGQAGWQECHVCDILLISFAESNIEQEFHRLRDKTDRDEQMRREVSHMHAV